MTRIRVNSFTISLGGYGAGPNQDLNNPLGVGATELHQWLLPTRTLQRTLFGKDGGTTGVDDDFAARGFQNVGAWILGRNMFGPIRGDCGVRQLFRADFIGSSSGGSHLPRNQCLGETGQVTGSNGSGTQPEA